MFGSFYAFILQSHGKHDPPREPEYTREHIYLYIQNDEGVTHKVRFDVAVEARGWTKIIIRTDYLHHGSDKKKSQIFNI